MRAVRSAHTGAPCRAIQHADCTGFRLAFPCSRRCGMLRWAGKALVWDWLLAAEPSTFSHDKRELTVRGGCRVRDSQVPWCHTGHERRRAGNVHPPALTTLLCSSP